MLLFKKPILLSILVITGFSFAKAESVKGELQSTIDARSGEYPTIAHKIWELAEPGCLEFESSNILKHKAEAEGFIVKSGVAGIPTAFVANYGTGKPVIGIMGEFDALPGLSQTASVERNPRVEGAAGHACGHHLFGTASLAAAIAIKDQIKAGTLKGTIRFYGTPAEEGVSGKVYMGRAGLDDDVDVMLHWHPGSTNDASPKSTNANKSAKFRFYGVAAHAASAPHKGRSALDGVEAMNLLKGRTRLCGETLQNPDGTWFHIGFGNRNTGV